MRRLRSWEWRKNSPLFLSAHLISQKAQTAPGTLHTWEVAQSQQHKNLDQALLSLIDFFPKHKLSPRSPAPAVHPQPMGCAPCPPCQHPQSSQRGAGAPGTRVSAGVLQLWDREHQGLTVSASHTLGIISKSPLRRAQPPEHGPALAWAALEAFLCFK